MKNSAFTFLSFPLAPAFVLSFRHGIAHAPSRWGDARDIILNICPAWWLTAAALALAMARDGSSGGCIRMCVITKDKVERHFIPGNELPRFWEGLEIMGEKKQAAPFAVAA